MGWASCCKGSDGVLSGRRKKKKDTKWRIFSLKELQSATNNFNYDNKLGEGGFGSVYWGQLWDGSQIAVKRLKSWSNKAETEFSIEVEHAAECHLGWERRMKIAIDSAEGITYLHHHATPHIIHRDIKASNILLDSNFQARVADFGFAKLIPDGATHVTTKVKGTLGYLAPEYAMLGKASESCDVFSFGVLLLELASGKRPVEKLNPSTKLTITEWALPLARDKKFKEIADQKLKDVFVEAELKRMVLVGLACTQNKPEQRLIMSEVVELLKGESTEKLSNLENDEMFKSDMINSCQGSSHTSRPDNSDYIAEEKNSKADTIDEAVDSSETLSLAR
ncbi:hypothetical protein GUJ93_ZPchr0006g44337 [Zizania palustris]|uniref:Protein kinase domain-containing protein n=1 Tax=Zizania palustris TaxID=103762 RepID=A0A8J5W1F8_ZIZPA|nr:hypothetical protein GUJ93_ZPchr0006g44337 [Zizania palustris]